MSMTTDSVPAGTVKSIVLTDGENRSGDKTVVVITGRATGVVTVKAKHVDGEAFFLPANKSTINLATEDNLIITGYPLHSIQIDDTGNTGATLTIKISKIQG